MLLSNLEIFYDLGHYPFWVDEADTALYARGIARTGDTYAMIDHNVFAVRQGTSLENLRGRYQPPGPFYFDAPFVGREGTGAFWPRFPFALCGLLTMMLMVYWMWRDNADPMLWIVFSIGLVTNVSLMLYFRQCRYYGLTTLLTMAAAYCYLHWDGRRRWLVIFSILATLLLLSQYMFYGALFVAIGCDYLLFQRKERRLSWRELAMVIGPQIVLAAIVVWIWNPIKDVKPSVPGRNPLFDKLLIFLWNFRDMNVCECGVGLLMLISPLLYFFDRNRWLLRLPLAILSYTLIITALSPQPAGATAAADVRYLSAILPLCILLTSLVIITLARHTWFVAIPLALLAFGTNTLNVPWQPHHWRSSIYLWVDELKTARSTSTQLTIDWINENVQPGQSVWVYPDYMTYPLMYHAPHALYAWQLFLPRQEQFENLPPIHFLIEEAPDYIVAFGRNPQIGQGLEYVKKHLNVDYDPYSTLDVYWDDMTRPELSQHSFKLRDDYNPDGEGVYILRRHELKPTAP